MYVQKAQLIFPTTRKILETIWYASIAFILASKSQLILIHLIFDYQKKYVLNAVKFLITFLFLVTHDANSMSFYQRPAEN